MSSSKTRGTTAHTQTSAVSRSPSKIEKIEKILGQMHAYETGCRLLEARLGAVEKAIEHLQRVGQSLWLEPDAKEVKEHLVQAAGGLVRRRDWLKIRLDQMQAKLRELRVQLDEVESA